MKDSLELVVHGNLVLPDRMLEQGWVGVRDGRVAALGKGHAPQARRTYHAGDALVFPGFVDGQTHACSYGGLPGLESTTRSAVAGGITTIVDMPYDNNGLVNSGAALERKAEAIEKLAYGDVALYATVAPGQGTGDLSGLIEKGACALKISSFESHPKRFPRIPNDEVLRLLEYAADTDLPVGLHNEDSEIVAARVREFVSQGCSSPEFHSPSRPPAAEMAATAMFLELGLETGAHVHIVHFSVPRGYELVSRYRSEGARATAELCVHYLHFDGHDDIGRLGAKMKVNPPIRSGVRDQLWSALCQDKVNFLSSDHSSWPIRNKLTPSIFDAGAGMTGLESMVPSLFTDLVRRGLDPVRFMRRYLAERPAKFFGVWPRKGAIAIGADADFTVLERTPVLFRESETHDDLNWSAYDGEQFDVRVAATFVRGRQMWNGSEILGAAGHGRFVPRTGASIFSPSEETRPERNADPPT